MTEKIVNEVLPIIWQEKSLVFFFITVYNMLQISLIPFYNMFSCIKTDLQWVECCYGDSKSLGLMYH